MPGLFEELVARYQTTNIPFPTLKPVTVAQWILESGRGTSRLATEHLNFAGLKWRSEMVGFATPVAHEAHDGLDFYCQFASLDAFIVGYWKFLSRAPYNGWEERAAESPEAFIRFIGPIYNPAGHTYVDQILALVAEATQRLSEAPAVPLMPPPPAVAGTPVVIVIDPGHGGTVEVGDSSPNNAISASGELEKHWTLDVAKRTRAAVLAKAVTLGKNVEVFLTRETDSNKGLTARANMAQSKGAKLFLSIHFNGFNKQVRGVETLIHPINVNKEEDRAFAQTIQDHLLAALHQIDPTTQNLSHYSRGVKEQKLGVLNDVALGNTAAAHPCRACLVEIEFMDVPAVEQLFRLQAPQTATVEQTARNRQQVADALADALLAEV
ncbi:MAG TPA: N-acetylmuramoyl-L-alanine amidase [Candidatus Tectomicrobia bacterium]|jgi:N-acetylmuramoyl-L-alanine amidase